MKLRTVAIEKYRSMLDDRVLKPTKQTEGKAA
jgi:hypothetical protein